MDILLVTSICSKTLYPDRERKFLFKGCAQQSDPQCLPSRLSGPFSSCTGRQGRGRPFASHLTASLDKSIVRGS